MARRSISGLYVIIDPDACRGRPAIAVARMALAGGAAIVQWRDKRRGEHEQLDDARALAGLCHEYGAIFIVNDYPDLALQSKADGVHLGQDDLSIGDVRPIVGDAMIIGASTNNAEEARFAEASGADYIAIGTIFPTSSKAVTRAASLERLREVKSAVHVPVVAIGGIDASNIAAVVEAGADAAAVISAVCAADDPRAAAAELAAACETAPPRARRAPQGQMPQPAVAITLKHNSAREAETRDALLALLERYDLSRWLVTRKVVIDERAIPHSHPVLTLHTRHAAETDRLLSTFIHEQLHRHLAPNLRSLSSKFRATRRAIKELRVLWPGVPTGYPEGDRNAASSYLHVVVNELEWRAMESLVGAERARAVMTFWCSDHYRAIYRFVMEERDRVAAIIDKHELAP